MVTVPGHNLREVMGNLIASHPGLRDRIFQDEGRIQDGIAFDIDGAVATMGLLEPVGEASEVHILPAIGGGALGDLTPALRGRGGWEAGPVGARVEE